MKELSLEYLVREPKTEVKEPSLLLMLHGYGSNEQDLFSFADELPDELLIVSARAPLSLGFGSYAWYSIRFSDDAANFSDIPEAKAALQKILAFLEEIKETFNIQKKNTFLLGFSQGTILSTAFAINHPDLVQHVVALSGYVNTKLLKEGWENHDFGDLDFFVSHGNVDQIIPVEWARKTPGFLDQMNISNEYREYPVGHGVAPQNFYDLKEWIAKRL